MFPVRFGAVTGALIAWAACVRPAQPDIVVVSPPDEPEPEPDTADTAEDTGDVATGGIRITYTWSAPMLPEIDRCSEAGVDTLWVQLDTIDDAPPRDPIAYPCVDAELRQMDVPVGGWFVSVWGDAMDGAIRWEAGEPAEVAVGVGEATSASVVLTCTEVSVDDGCGGA